MRLFLLYIIGLVWTLQLDAQTIRFTDSSNKWSILKVHADPAPHFYSESAQYIRDAQIAGVNYRRLSYGPLAIREDSAAGIIYCRFLSNVFFGFQGIDSAEHVFFNYNLKTGRLRITDAFGRNIVNRQWDGKTAFPVGQFLSIPGVYGYTLEDERSGNVSRGRFVFQ